MRILICDDDPLIVEQIQKYVRSYFEKHHVKCPELVCFFDGVSLLSDKGDKDILFLDIEMPGMTGLECAKSIQDTDPRTILVFAKNSETGVDNALEIMFGKDNVFKLAIRDSGAAKLDL